MCGSFLFVWSPKHHPQDLHPIMFLGGVLQKAEQSWPARFLHPATACAGAEDTGPGHPAYPSRPCRTRCAMNLAASLAKALTTSWANFSTYLNNSCGEGCYCIFNHSNKWDTDLYIYIYQGEG